jgi:protein-S-isoprenylcysteine O-methyltransferase Ste14
MSAHYSSLIAASCVIIYWGTVAIKCIRIARVIRKDPNVIPRERTGRLLRLVWAPVLGIWIAYPLLHLHKMHTASPLWGAISLCGAVICIFALGASYHCWREMGTSWRIGIDPNEKTTMIVSGAYRCVRHPIYALSIMLVLGTLAAIPTFVMLVVALIHTALMQIEARREEQHMLRTQGEVYRNYMKTAGRFIPRF